MSVFQSAFDALRGFPRRLSEAGREVRRTASLAGAAMLAALSLVLNQFTIAVSQFLEIGFSFLAAGTCAFLYGPWLAGLMGIVTLPIYLLTKGIFEFRGAGPLENVSWTMTPYSGKSQSKPDPPAEEPAKPKRKR